VYRNTHLDRTVAVMGSSILD